MNIFSAPSIHSENQVLKHSILKSAEVHLHIKREDLIHEKVSGNKFRKLKYNLEEAKKLGYTRILTFGGAYSNHIAATAAAGKMVGLATVGVIRGEELKNNLQKTLSENETLRFAKECGMHLEFISRESYRNKNSLELFNWLTKQIGDFYLIPEGGTNELAVKGCEEILSNVDEQYDFICCAIGTGGTISGLINSSFSHQKVLGFPALKGDFLSENIKKYTTKKNWNLFSEYHFGGYGKINKELIEFINRFQMEQHIGLDPIYVGKMLYGLFDMIKNGFFSKNTRILAIHTGGLQGISGMNNKLSKKKLPLIVI